MLRSRGIEGYSLEAKLLTAGAAGKTIAQLTRDFNLYTSREIEDRVNSYIARRLNGEPVAYITGSWEFYGIPLEINSDVLIPRMDTELLVDITKELLTGNKMDARVLDLCCGSGCIACAIASEMPATKLVAVDISGNALEVARRNIESCRLTSRVKCIQADAAASPPLGIGLFDVIVSNPPYISTDEIQLLDRSVKDYEPFWALDGGPDGLKFYKAIIKYWKSLLRPGGHIIFEVGEGQSTAVREMLESASFASTAVYKDTLGIERAVVGTMNQ